MDKAKVDQLLEVTLHPMREMINCLRSDEHWAVYVYLLERNDIINISISKIAEALGSTVEEINPILLTLSEGGLVSKHAKNFQDINDPDKQFIKVTSLGVELYGALFNVVIPPLKRKGGPLKIIVTKRSSDYHAQVEGIPKLWCANTSPYAAVGDLISTHRDYFAFEIEWKW